LGESNKKKVSIPEYVVNFAAKMYRKCKGQIPIVICYDVTQKDNQTYFRTEEMGHCLYEPQYTFFENWVAGVQMTFDAQGKCVEWNVFEQHVKPEVLADMKKANAEIEAVNRD
jgi:hypothetical protein